MSRIDALKDLLAKVEAGAAIDRLTIWKAFDREARFGGWPIGQIFDWILDPQDVRAMGAAKALHEEELPGWRWSVGYSVLGSGHLATVYLPHADDSKWKVEVASSNNPARALLIAILKALIAIEEDRA